MDRIKRIIALSVSILAVALLASAASWEGSAMMGSYGDFPTGGYFAACNSFPRNTAVEVTNLETGKTVTVIIVRGLDNPGLFMMVSAEAADALGLRQGKITRVRAVEPRSVSSLAPSAGSRTALDADFNPRLLAAEELERMGYDIVETPAKAQAAPEAAPVVASVPKAAEAAAVKPEAVAAAPEPIKSVPPVIAPLPAVAPDGGPHMVQDLVRPEPATPKAATVPVPSPEAPRMTSSEQPDAINGGKPKPVRTVVLPELPEPEVASTLAKVAPLPAATETGPIEVSTGEKPGPEIMAMNLPVPDETPIRVSPSVVPKRFEAPAALPDVLDRPRTSPLAPGPLELSLVEPQAPGPEGFIALPLETPAARDSAAGLAPGEPGTKTMGRAVAHELMKPPLQSGVPLASLAWPELEADEIPDVVLARLAEPVQMVPATSLAEGEVIFPLNEKPSAVALETPSFGAAETRLALTTPELEALEQAEVLAPAAPGTLATDVEVELSEADSAAKSPLITEREAPGEVVVVMEPTDLRPPVAGAPVVTEQAPVVKGPAPLESAPATAATVSPVVVRPAMATGSLEKGKHYIQVGAYRTEAVAAATVSVLRMDYVIVLEVVPGSSTKIWKIFVGPLGRDESGIALLRVRSLGFKDAFLKIGG